MKSEMEITLTPVRMDATLTLRRDGDTLIINGDLVPLVIEDLENGDDDPVERHPFLLGRVTKTAGVWNVAVLWPYGADMRLDPPAAKTIKLPDEAVFP